VKVSDKQSPLFATFSGQHGGISQKILFFITTAVRTSNPTMRIVLRGYIYLNNKGESIEAREVYEAI
jgi:hypothetical protein